MQFGPIGEDLGVEFAAQMLSGLAHLHRSLICHNSLTTAAVIIEEGKYTVKLRNLENISRADDDLIPGLSLDLRGSDIHNAAVLLFQAITGVHPHATQDLYNLLELSSFDEYWRIIDPDLMLSLKFKTLFSKLLNPLYLCASVEEVTSDPWFQQKSTTNYEWGMQNLIENQSSIASFM